MQLTIKINMDNAAFYEGPEENSTGEEAARIISRLAGIIEDFRLDNDSGGNLFDKNGNNVGNWYVIE